MLDTKHNLPDHSDQPDDPDGQEITIDDALFEAQAIESNQRLWLKQIQALLHIRRMESDPSHRVQLAQDLMMIAACERAARILRSDLPEDRA